MTAPGLPVAPGRRQFGFDTRGPVRALAWAITAMLVAGLLAFVARGADRPKNPYLLPAPRAAVGSFGELGFRIDATLAKARCALVAETPAQQQQGLKGRRDLGGRDGMLFRFDDDVTTPFVMKDTLLPLSIAWFDRAGGFVGATDMVPCPPAQADCPLYRAPAPYRYALEVPRGQLKHLGIGPGSHLLIQGGCTS